MKQTNNAIKFLMAQYRAIFKNAYFKGIASAVLLTAGLAVAGNAQAAAANVTSAQLAGTEEITVDGTTNTKLGGTLDDLGTLWNAPVKVTGGDNNSTNALTQTNDVNISGSGSLTIETTNASDGVKITAADNKNLSISINALNVNKGALLIEGGATDAKNATFSANTISLGQANGSDGDAKVTLNKTGVSGTVTIGSATSSIRLAKTAEVVFAATAADDAVLEGSLQATGGKLNFSGAGTLKTYTDADGVNVDITVAGEKGATLDLSAQTEEANKTMKLVGGTFDIKGGTTAGTFTVTNGTLDIGSDVNLTNSVTGAKAGTLTISGTQVADATVRVDSTVLKNFLTANDGDQAGSVSLTKGTLELVGNELFDLATDVTFGDANTAGAITQGTNSGDSVIKGTNLAVSAALADAKANKVAIVATDTLTLGKSDAASTDLKFGSATARNLTLLSNSDTFTLANNVTLKAIDEVDNPFLTAEGTIKVAGNGQLEAKNTTISGASAQLTIAAGNYSTGYNVKLASGALTVGGQAAATTADTYAVDASLKLTGKLSLDNASGNNTITIAGNGATQSIDTDDGTPIARPVSATLDLTDVTDIEINRDASNKTTINVNGGGELLVSSAGFAQLVNVAGTANSGAEVVLSGGGYTFVEGSIKGESNTGLSTVKFTSGAAAGTDRVRFNGEGLVEASDTIWLADDGTTHLNIASGALKAQTLRLDGKDDDAFQVVTGTLTAGTRVESSNGNSIQLGNGTSGATLNLGYIEADRDKWGRPTGTYTTSSATGSVTTDLTLSGGTSGQSKLNVNYGAWTAKDIAVNSGDIVIGASSDADGTALADPSLYKASLSANKLTLGANASTTVNTNGSATLNELVMSNGALNVYGTMTVNGNFVEGNDKATPPTNDTYGVNITGGEIKVSGRNANLIFGEDAVKAITLNPGTAAVGNTPATPASVIVASGTFTNNISVDEFGLLTLNFAEGTTFNADSLKSLRQYLLDSSVSTNGSALEAGYINLGAATIDGVHVSEQGTIDWANLKDFADIDQLQDIVTDDMASATLINVNGTDTVTANVANIRLDGNQQTVNLGDAYLADANGGISNGNFVFNEDNPSQAGNANVTAGAHVTLANGGNIGSVSLAAGNNAEEGKTIFNVIAQDPNAVTNIQEISAGDNTLVNISGTTEVAGRVNVDDLQADAALTAAGAVNVNGDLSDTATSPALAQGSISAASLTVDGVTHTREPKQPR